MIKHYTQGLATDAELFAHVGKWALCVEAHKQIGNPVTGNEGDVWLVDIKNGKAIGFAQLRPMKNNHFHMRYLYSDSLSAKLELGNAVMKKAAELGAELVYTNERRESPVMPQIGFTKTNDNPKTRFSRWERKIANES